MLENEAQNPRQDEAGTECQPRDCNIVGKLARDVEDCAPIRGQLARLDLGQNPTNFARLLYFARVNKGLFERLGMLALVLPYARVSLGMLCNLIGRSADYRVSLPVKRARGHSVDFRSWVRLR